MNNPLDEASYLREVTKLHVTFALALNDAAETICGMPPGPERDELKRQQLALIAAFEMEHAALMKRSKEFNQQAASN